MKYIKNDEQSIELITNFLKENKYVLEQINFTEFNAFIDAKEELGELKGVSGFLSDGGFRSVGLFAMLDIADEKTTKNIKFIVNDFEFNSVFDGKTQISFNDKWCEYMVKFLNQEEKQNYKRDLETFTKQNIFENI